MRWWLHELLPACVIATASGYIGRAKLVFGKGDTQTQIAVSFLHQGKKDLEGFNLVVSLEEKRCMVYEVNCTSVPGTLIYFLLSAAQDMFLIQ
eukprot:1138636-Pelagomonas_calceolata.AAC.2